MEQINPRSRRDAYGSRINRDHSPVIAYGLPWLTILAASVVTTLPVSSAIAIWPPLALLTMVAWRLVRPGLLPVWAGFPIGLWDDLFSGQPFGCGILLFSLAMLAIEMIETRFPWRNFLHDWLTAGALAIAYLLLALILSGGRIDTLTVTMLWPQALLSIIAYPIIARMVAIFDRVRLLRIRRLG